MNMKSKTLERHKKSILSMYKEKGKIKISFNERETKSGKKSYSIRVAKFNVSYRNKEDRDKDLEELKESILTVFPKPGTSF